MNGLIPGTNMVNPSVAFAALQGIFRVPTWPDFVTAATDVWRHMIIPKPPSPSRRKPLMERAIVADRDGLTSIEMCWVPRGGVCRWRIRLEKREDGLVHVRMS